MRTECSECGATYSAANDCRICAKPLTPKPGALLSPDEAERLRSAHESRKPSSDLSGLLDIRNISAKLRAETTVRATQVASLAAGPSGSLALPSFAGDGLDGLSAAPLLAPQPTPAQTPAQPSRGPLYALLGVLSLGVLGLGAIVVEDQLRPPPSPAHAAALAPVLDEAEAQPEPDRQAEAADEPEADAADPETNSNSDSASAEPDAEPSARPRDRRRPRNQSTKPEASESDAAAKPTTKPSKKLDDDALVDCLLGSNDPKCKAAASSPAPTTKPKPKPDTSSADLPNKLGPSEIGDGIKPVKTAAKSCGSGLTVAVKFSVEGASGKVLSATPLDEHASSSAGACVAKAARKAQFPRFGSARQGFTFKFRL